MSSRPANLMRRTLTAVALSCTSARATFKAAPRMSAPSAFVSSSAHHPRCARTATTITSVLQAPCPSISASARANRKYLACAALSTSAVTNFTPPTPPSSKGQAVFDNLDLSQKSPAAIRRNSDPNAVFVVTGANRGIGIQFVKSLLDRTQGTIVACCRAPEQAHGLDAIKTALPSNQQNRVKVQRLDIENQASIEKAAESIKSSFGRVDVLLNVAGILGDGKVTPGPERSISKIDRNWLEKNLAVNAVGPLMLVQALSPLMQTKGRVHRKKDNDGNYEVDRAASVVASLSARVGSISDNDLGGWISYRLSKAALNQATRTMAHELKRQGTWAVALHPGTTDTDLSKPFQGNVQDGRLFPVDFTASQLLDCIDSLDESKSGGFYDWSGTALPF